MKMKFLPLPVLVAGLCLLSTGCLPDDAITSSGGSSSGGAYEEQLPADDEIDSRVCEAMDLSAPGLETVREAAEAQAWGRAAAALLDYYRNRSAVTNPNVNLLTPSASEAEQKQAAWALKESGYRFYVKGFSDPDAPEEGAPYSYLADDGVSIDWQKFATADQELAGQIHRHQWFIPQAKTFRVTGDARYLKSYMDVYDDWWKANPAPERVSENDQKGKQAWIPLSVAARVMDQCNLLEYYKWADDFSAAYLSRFLCRLDEQVEFIKNNYWETSNHRISQAQAVTIAGLLMPEMKRASAWVDNGSGVLSEEILKQYYPDGWLKDNDLHYHIGSIESFRQALLIATLNGQPDRFGSTYVDAIRKMVDVEKYLLYPNYSVYNSKINGQYDYNYSTPNFGDTRPVSWSRNVLLRHMRNYRDLFPDDAQLQWLASGGVEGESLPAGIKCFPDGGHYTLRSGMTRQSTMMVLVNAQVSPAEQWHRQWDNNNFELYVNGRQFFPDSGCFSYGGTQATNAARRKYAATAAHSTLTLGDANVASCRGRCLKAEEGAQFDLLVLENPSYEGLTHRRAVFFVNRKFFVIVDEGYGSAAGSVNLNFHLLPGSDAEVVLDGEQCGAHTAFADGNNLLVRTFSPAALTASEKEGFLSVAENVTTARKAYRVAQEKTAEMPAARFITVLYPAADASAASVTAQFNDNGFNASGATVRVTADGKTYNLSYKL